MAPQITNTHRLKFISAAMEKTFAYIKTLSHKQLCIPLHLYIVGTTIHNGDTAFYLNQSHTKKSIYPS